MVTNDPLMTRRAKKDKSIPAGEFKTKCLALFDEVEVRRRSYVVTKRGRPVARIVPMPATTKDSLHGSLGARGGSARPYRRRVG
jgi:prevent-host-death family protein